MENKDSILRYKGVSYVLPFILVTGCFALWGFANDITNPMVQAFSAIFSMSVTAGTMVQVAFYGGYFLMALPAAIFIRKYSYKAGVMLGLGLYALGALLFLPAKEIGLYFPFLIAYVVMTCGCSVLETSCNPYILSMGSPETATRRLNFAQAFNPLGSICGMFIALNFIMNRISPLTGDERAELDPAQFEALKEADLSVIMTPYLIIGIVIIAMLMIFALVKMPKTQESSGNVNFLPTISRLLKLPRYREGVIAQFFYVGAQIMCWTFILQYGTHLFQMEGMDEKAARLLSQKYNIIAMAIFISSRFICTYLMKYIKAFRLLTFFGIFAIILTLGVIFFQNRMGIICLVGISACMSLMFPTIYGIALEGLGEDAKFGAAGLIMSIVGGAILPPLQAIIIDSPTVFGMPGVNISFVVPAICFLVVAIYGFRCNKFSATA